MSNSKIDPTRFAPLTATEALRRKDCAPRHVEADPDGWLYIHDLLDEGELFVDEWVRYAVEPDGTIRTWDAVAQFWTLARDLSAARRDEVLRLAFAPLAPRAV